MAGIILDADQVQEGISHGFIRLPQEDQVVSKFQVMNSKRAVAL